MRCCLGLQQLMLAMTLQVRLPISAVVLVRKARTVISVRVNSHTFSPSASCAGNGVGHVTLKPPGPTYTAGTIATLTATPSITSTFTGWSGDIVTTSNPLTVTMMSNQTIAATFALKPYLIYLPNIMR
jgi:hypothetical protein